MKLFYPFALLFLSFSLNGQVAKDLTVPDVVQKEFSKKFPRAENVSWNQVEKNYKVDCFFRGRANYAEFTPEGEWVMTVTDLDTKNLYAPIQRYLDENFKRDKVILAEKAVKADRQDYYYVQVEINEVGLICRQQGNQCRSVESLLSRRSGGQHDPDCEDQR